MLRYQGHNFEFYGKKVKQVNKIAAKNAYERGKTIYLLACNLRPNNVWQKPAAVNRNQWKLDTITFDNVVNTYIYYNCDNERGKYPIFFVEVN